MSVIYLFLKSLHFSASLLFNQPQWELRTIHGVPIIIIIFIPTIITHLYILRFHDLAGGVLKFVVLNRDNHHFKQPQLNLSVFG